MPKEIIYGQDSRYDVAVGWSPDQYVQVGVTAHDGRTDAERRAEDAPAQADSSLWTDLDRQGINRLIRTLRRARDSVFGRDE